ncbi:MAG: hypothetical protein KF812_09200 [Fimbriimonadaceae bacterium]|nr:hypothetical protein [Fimbriimonadaceae bacterium]
MKLNLLPTGASKGSMAIFGIISCVVLALAGILGAMYMIFFSNGELTKAKERVDTLQPMYAQVKAVSDEANTIMAGSTDFDRNLKLANAMIKHNGDYVALYEDVFGVLPSWFRVTSISAAPANEQYCTVSINGVLQTNQQYADMMLALGRMPGLVQLGRSGFVDTNVRRPGLNETDQIGTPIKPGEDQLPSDPWERFNALTARGATTPSGFQNISGFGSGDINVRGAMTDWSAVTFTMVVARNIQTPDPVATLRAGGAAGAPAGTTPGAPGTPGVPGVPPATGVPPGAGGRGQGVSPDDQVRGSELQEGGSA